MEITTPKNTEAIITSEDQYVAKLADIAKTAGYTNFDLLTTKEPIEAKEAELQKFIAVTQVTDDNFAAAIELWNQYKDLVKNGVCKFDLNNLEVKTIDKKLHSSVEYTTETLFYGLHLKKTFVDELPKVKGDDFIMNSTTITFSNALALYHVLSSLTVKGLNKENYAFANILYKLSEISKVYQHYDSASSRLNQAIGQWSMGLNAAQAGELTQAIEETVKAESAEVSA